MLSLIPVTESFGAFYRVVEYCLFRIFVLRSVISLPTVLVSTLRRTVILLYIVRTSYYKSRIFLFYVYYVTVRCSSIIKYERDKMVLVRVVENCRNSRIHSKENDCKFFRIPKDGSRYVLYYKYDKI